MLSFYLYELHCDENKPKLGLLAYVNILVDYFQMLSFLKGRKQKPMCGCLVYVQNEDKNCIVRFDQCESRRNKADDELTVTYSWM